MFHVLAPFIASLSLLIYPITAQSCSTQDNVLITFYGYPDNDPPGAGIGGQCGRPLAGGTGTYSDPITFATTATGDFKQCEVVYLPWVKKYARLEDSCAKCSEDWDSSRQYHIDLWTGSTTVNGGDLQIQCENSLPGGQQSIVRSPPDGLETDTTPFFSNGNYNRKTFPVGSNLCAASGGSKVLAKISSADSPTITAGPDSLPVAANFQEEPTTGVMSG
ncbi:MAG: hypothetical protein Q9168_005696 [Polycauliona sp. 1 TL-2023]